MQFQPTKLVNLVPLTEDGTAITIKAKFGAMTDYSDFHGTSITQLPNEILESLAVESVSVQLDYYQRGIVPTLVYKVSDKAQFISFDQMGMLHNFIQHNQKPQEDDNETP